MRTYVTPLLAVVAGVAGASAWLLGDPTAEADEAKKSSKNAVMEVAESVPVQPEGPVNKSESEWKKALTPEQYRILRKAGTERAGGKVYKEFKEQGAGTYFCAGCNAELFTSNEKFDSHCGWPSFYDPSKAKNVKTSVDFHLGYARTEVLCKVCDGHLGHVFSGEGFATPTDKRYCINGTVLKFVPAKAGDSKLQKAETSGEKAKKSATGKKGKSQ